MVSLWANSIQNQALRRQFLASHIYTIRSPVSTDAKPIMNVSKFRIFRTPVVTNVSMLLNIDIFGKREQPEQANLLFLFIPCRCGQFAQRYLPLFPLLATRRIVGDALFNAQRFPVLCRLRKLCPVCLATEFVDFHHCYFSKRFISKRSLSCLAESACPCTAAFVHHSFAFKTSFETPVPW